MNNSANVPYYSEISEQIHDDNNVMYYDNGNNQEIGVQNNFYLNNPFLKYGNMVHNDPYYNQQPAQIDYDGILKSLNVKMANGRLERDDPYANSGIFKGYQPQHQNQHINFSKPNNSNLKPYQSPIPKKKVETKPVSLKNDSFYKYFKNHNIGSYNPEKPSEEDQEREKIKSMTKEEYEAYRRQKYLEEEQKRRIIKETKSRNMRFTAGDGATINKQIKTSQPNTRSSFNQLFNFSNKR